MEERKVKGVKREERGRGDEDGAVKRTEIEERNRRYAKRQR